MYACINRFNEQAVFSLQHHGIDQNGISQSVTLHIGKDREVAIGMDWNEMGELIDFLRDQRALHDTKCAQALYPELW